MVTPVRYRTLADGSRHRVVVLDGIEGYEVRGVSECWGCFESCEGLADSDYPYDAKARCYLGSGCDECGYTGKRRWTAWVPFDLSEAVARSA